MKVTDFPRETKQGKKFKGFYMDGYLAQNLYSIPNYLKKDFDCVGIVSGRGLVGVGKSCLAIQIGYYLAWLLAGGEMDFSNNCVLKNPTKPIKFNIEENLCFSPDEMQNKAKALYNKYGRGQVLIYDEGRGGLESSRTMEAVNKGMEDFLQESRVLGLVLIIVLPNYFKLHEDYSVARSIFLVDAFLTEDFKRGYFNFYNRIQKERLYYFGKKKIGVTAKYMSAYPNFWGRFTDWMPFEKKEYEKAKIEGLAKKIKTRREKNVLIQRDFLVWLLKQEAKITDEEILKKFDDILDISISIRTLKLSREKINEIISRKRGY